MGQLLEGDEPDHSPQATQIRKHLKSPSNRSVQLGLRPRDLTC